VNPAYLQIGDRVTASIHCVPQTRRQILSDSEKATVQSSACTYRRIVNSWGQRPATTSSENLSANQNLQPPKPLQTNAYVMVGLGSHSSLAVAAPVDSGSVDSEQEMLTSGGALITGGRVSSATHHQHRTAVKTKPLPRVMV
jgi:hypothetical protein